MNEKTEAETSEGQTAPESHVENAHAPKPERDPATVAYEQRFGGASPAAGNEAETAIIDDAAAGVGDAPDTAASAVQQTTRTVPGAEVASHMRPGHRLLTDAEVQLIQEIDFLAGELQERFNEADANRGTVHGDAHRSQFQRGMALARTNLEQAVMWATKGITS